MSALALSEEVSLRRKASRAKKTTPTAEDVGCCDYGDSGDSGDIGMYGDRENGYGRRKSDMPYGMGDVYPMWSGVDDTRPWTKLFLSMIQANPKIKRLPKPMYDQLWHFFNGHYAHYTRERMMVMWTQVAAFYKLLKDRKAYPGWDYKYDFDTPLRQGTAPFQETVIEMFKELARSQLGINTSKPLPTGDAAEKLAGLSLDPVAPRAEGSGRMAGLSSLLTLGQSLQKKCCDAPAAEQSAGSTAVFTPEPAEEPTEEMNTNYSPVNPSEVVSSTEHHLLTWFRESHVNAKHALRKELASTVSPGIKWFKGDTESAQAKAHATLLSHQRMRDIGMVYEDGSLPQGPNPMPLYWIQAKPSEAKEHFGAWDPVNASWRIHEDRTVVPIERRYAPVECGYGTNPEKERLQQVCKQHDYFTDYKDVDLYFNTGLEPGVEYIQMQAEALPMGTMLGTEHGWGASESGDAIYYTPQLRHVEIDRSIEEAPGKQFVYGWYGINEPVVPSPCAVFSPPGNYVGQQPFGEWSSTNSCWMFPLDSSGNLTPAGVCVGDTERERDEDMREELAECEAKLF